MRWQVHRACVAAGSCCAAAYGCRISSRKAIHAVANMQDLGCWGSGICHWTSNIDCVQVNAAPMNMHKQSRVQQLILCPNPRT